MTSLSINDGGKDIEHGGGVAVEMATAAPTDSLSSSTSPTGDSISISEDQITPLLNQSQRPKVNIFCVSYPRRRPVKEQLGLAETETSPFLQFTFWIWSGTRYSGLLCMALSSIIYCIMEVVSDVFTAQSIPLFEMAFARCTIILILSFVWLKRSRQPIFGTSSISKLLALRAFMGYLSLMSFIYCIQRVPFSRATILSFTTPIMAAIAARVIMHEKLRIAEIGGLACSFFGVIFIFRPMLDFQAGTTDVGEADSSYVKGSYHLYAVLVGLFSSTVGGVSYCFTRAGAKAADQPVLTVFAFGLFASPAAAICTFTFEGFVLPGFHTLLLMLALGSLAFCAEITTARALQLEKTSKVANVLYLEAASSQLLGMSLSRIVPTFGRLVGCSLILISACCTMYIGPEKLVE